jgi:hypothetical protein
VAGQSIPNTQQVARAGEYFVTGELYRRGAYVVQFPGNTPKVDLSASDQDLTRTVSIQVKTKSERSQSWQVHTTDGRARDLNSNETRFLGACGPQATGNSPGLLCHSRVVDTERHLYRASSLSDEPWRRASSQSRVDSSRFEPCARGRMARPLGCSGNLPRTAWPFLKLCV